MIPRDLRGPGLRGYILCEQKVPKKSLKPGGLRIPYITGEIIYATTCRLAGLSSVLWADAGLYFCARSYRWCWLPRGTRHEGLVEKVQIRRMFR